MPLYITKKKTDYFSQTKKGGKANWIIERMFFFYFLFECISVTSLGPLT